MSVPRNVFVVDDDPVMLSLMQRILQLNGMNVQVFSGAEEFLRAIPGLRQAPGCLLLDVMMPDMSGPELQVALNRQGVPFSIVFCSAATPHAPGTIVEALRNGAFDFLPKPIDQKRLVERIEAALLDAERRFAECEEAKHFESRLAELSSSERCVLRLLVDGRNPKEISAALEMSPSSVGRHSLGVMRKMKARNVLELARQVWEFGGIDARHPTPHRPSGGTLHKRAAVERQTSAPTGWERSVEDDAEWTFPMIPAWP